ncbi:DUF58 domain-containing protein [Pirellulaceae bacterium SH467]
MTVKNPLLRWLTPTDMTRVGSLQLLARQVVEGVRGGIHRSRHTGASVDFKEHRPYVTGDEIRSIDWKLFGKTDRLYIRQYEDETNLRCTIWIDQSGSMNYAGRRAAGLTKHEYAVRLAACMAYLLVSQQDAVGVATFEAKIRLFLPPKNQPGHLHQIMELLTQSTPGGEADWGRATEEFLRRSKRRGLVIILSDTISDAESVVKSLALLRSNQQEVVLFQVVDEDELDFPFQQRTMFRSLELATDEQLVEPATIRARYLENLHAHQETIRTGCERNGVDLISLTTAQSYSEAIQRYLARRRGAR